MSSPSFLDGGGEAARMIRERDWSDHPLGPPEGWSPEFRTALSLVLNSPESMILAWGPDLHFFFNDTYFPLLGPRLPWAMGERFDKVWADGWEQAKPIIDAAFAGRSRRFEDLPWKLGTDRGLADTWWSFSYSRVLDGEGRVAGLFIFTNETTARVLGENALRESEERLRLVIESARDHAILTTDPAGLITSWSAGAQATFGWSAEEAVGQRADVLFTPEDRAADVPGRELAAAAAKGCGNDERWHVTKDGRRVFMNGSVRPLPRDAGDRERGFIKIARDETRRRGVEEALRESEAQFRTFAQAVPNHVWSATPDGRLDWANAQTYAYSGGSPDRAIGDTWTERVHPDDRSRAAERWAAALASGEVYETQLRIRRADGAYRWFLARALPVRGTDGAIVRWIGSNTDVEDQRAAIEELARLNATLEQEVAERTADRNALWQLSRDIMLRCTFEGVMTAVNPAWTEVLGWRDDELIGANLFDFIHPDDTARTTEGARQLSEGTGHARFDNRYRHKDGRYRWISWSTRPAEGVINAVGRDVTAEKEQADALAQTEEALRQAQKMEAVGQLTGGVAHDFNNLLTVIRSSTDLLRRPDLAEERRTRYVMAIADAVERAAKLTGQLLAFARRQALRPEVFDVGQSVRAIGEMVGTLTGARIQVTIRVPEVACYIEADASQFDTTLVNMAVNARDAMNGEGRLTISVRTTEELPAMRSHPAVVGDFVAVALSDTGTGIAPDLRDRVFEPFYTTKGVGQGTGLGLSQVFGFAKQSGGEVMVESEIGQGSTFTIYLPRARGPVRVEARSAEPEATEGGRGLRVMVVEDNVDVGTFSTQTLEELGYRTHWVASAEEALAELAGSPGEHDVVFSDVVMPGMNGVDLAREIGRRHPGLPVVLTSGYSHVLAQEGSHEFELLQKPYSVEALSRVLREAAGKRRRGRAAARG